MDPEHRISVNFATPRELRIIPGVGDKMAEAIVEMRLRNSNVAFPTALKKGRVLARKGALLMREIHPKGHFC